MRHDFTARTKDILAKRVGYRCSNPNCRLPTSGPQDDPAKAVNARTGRNREKPGF